MKAGESDLKSAQYKGCARVKSTLLIPLDRLEPDPGQPRKDFEPESLQRLAQSVKDKGQLLPVRVRWDDERGRWVIISGERRFRAARLAGLTAVPCVECAVPVAEDDVLEEQLVENRHREDLKPMEQALAYRRLMDLRAWSARQLAHALYLSESSVSRALALLELPEAVRGRVESGELTASVAYELSKVDDPAAQQALAERVLEEGLNRSQAAAVVREATGRPPRRSKSTESTVPGGTDPAGVSADSPGAGAHASRGRGRSVIERAFVRGTVEVTVRFRPGDDVHTFLELLDRIRSEALALFGQDDETRAA